MQHALVHCSKFVESRSVAVDEAEAHSVLRAVEQLRVELQRFVVVLNAKRLNQLQRKTHNIKTQH